MANESNFVPIPGPKLLEAIGTVTVKWAVLEFLLDNQLWWVTDPSDPDVEPFMKRSSTRGRWDRLKDILRVEYKDNPETVHFLKLIDHALSIKGERDAIVHGLYTDPTKPQNDALIIMMKGNKVRNEWPVSAKRAKETAQKIDDLTSAIFHQLFFRAGEDIGGGSRLPNTWRHKDRR